MLRAKGLEITFNPGTPIENRVLRGLDLIIPTEFTSEFKQPAVSNRVVDGVVRFIGLWVFLPPVL